VLCGFDSKALEARVQAHYQAPYDNGAFIHTVCHGKKEDKTSIHFVNQRAFEAESYDDAKTGYYALLYGAGDIKLGKTFTHVNDPVLNRKRGRAARLAFERNQPGYKLMKEAVQEVAKARGFLRAIDGHPLKVRSPHSALNTLFQSAGAILMKLTLVLLDKYLQAAGLTNSDTSPHGILPDYEFVGNIHDEGECETWKIFGDLIGSLSDVAHQDAAEFLKCRCPLSTDASIGPNWAETH
jgi:DNA polymerase I-like protein with 3'-5' exonuclease and polymerase domains